MKQYSKSLAPHLLYSTFIEELKGRVNAFGSTSQDKIRPYTIFSPDEDKVSLLLDKWFVPNKYLKIFKSPANSPDFLHAGFNLNAGVLVMDDYFASENSYLPTDLDNEKGDFLATFIRLIEKKSSDPNSVSLESVIISGADVIYDYGDCYFPNNQMTLIEWLLSNYESIIYSDTWLSNFFLFKLIQMASKGVSLSPVTMELLSYLLRNLFTDALFESKFWNKVSEVNMTPSFFFSLFKINRNSISPSQRQYLTVLIKKISIEEALKVIETKENNEGILESFIAGQHYKNLPFLFESLLDHEDVVIQSFFKGALAQILSSDMKVVFSLMSNNLESHHKTVELLKLVTKKSRAMESLKFKDDSTNIASCIRDESNHNYFLSSLALIGEENIRFSLSLFLYLFNTALSENKYKVLTEILKSNWSNSLFNFSGVNLQYLQLLKRIKLKKNYQPSTFNAVVDALSSKDGFELSLEEWIDIGSHSNQGALSIWTALIKKKGVQINLTGQSLTTIKKTRSLLTLFELTPLDILNAEGVELGKPVRKFLLKEIVN